MSQQWGQDYGEVTPRRGRHARSEPELSQQQPYSEVSSAASYDSSGWSSPSSEQPTSTWRQQGQEYQPRRHQHSSGQQEDPWAPRWASEQPDSSAFQPSFQPEAPQPVQPEYIPQTWSYEDPWVANPAAAPSAPLTPQPPPATQAAAMPITESWMREQPTPASPQVQQHQAWAQWQSQPTDSGRGWGYAPSSQGYQHQPSATTYRFEQAEELPELASTRRWRAPGEEYHDERSRYQQQPDEDERDDDGHEEDYFPPTSRRLLLRLVGLTCLLASVGMGLNWAKTGTAIESQFEQGQEQQLIAIAQTQAMNLLPRGAMASTATEAGTGSWAALAQNLKTSHNLAEVKFFAINRGTSTVTVVANTAGTNIGSQLVNTAPGYTALLSGKAVSQPVQCNQGEECLIAWASAEVGNPTVGVALTRSVAGEKEPVTRQKRQNLVLAIVLVALVGALLFYLLSRWVFGPLRQIQHGLRGVVEGRVQQRLDWDDDNELAAVADEVDAVAGLVEQQNHHMQHLALEDPLTGLPNRRAGLTLLASDITLASREGVPITVVALEVDHLRHDAHRYGQHVVDQTLRKMADAARLAIQTNDRCIRLEQDRFLLVLHGQSSQQAHATVDRLRDIMARLRVGATGHARLHTGVVESWADVDAQELMRRAEDELSRATSRLALPSGH